MLTQRTVGAIVLAPFDVLGLAWLCAVVLVPGFVVVIEIWRG